MNYFRFVLFVFIFSASAQAKEGSFLGGLGIGTNHYSTDAPAGITYGSGTGIVLKGTSDLIPIGPAVLRAGLFFQNRSYKRTSSAGDSVTSYKNLGLTGEAIYDWFPFLSVGGGIYVSSGIGTVSTKLANGTTSDAEFSDVALAKMDYGMKATVRGKYPVAEKISAVADLDYLFGLKDLSTVVGKVNRRDLWILVGASYEF